MTLKSPALNKMPALSLSSATAPLSAPVKLPYPVLERTFSDCGHNSSIHKNDVPCSLSEAQPGAQSQARAKPRRKAKPTRDDLPVLLARFDLRTYQNAPLKELVTLADTVHRATGVIGLTCRFCLRPVPYRNSKVEAGHKHEYGTNCPAIDLLSQGYSPHGAIREVWGFQ